MIQVHIINNHEYNLIDDHEKIILQYSNNPFWSERLMGTDIIVVEDDGNGVKIFIDGKKRITLNYAELEALTIALKYLHKNSDCKYLETKELDV